MKDIIGGHAVVGAHIFEEVNKDLFWDLCLTEGDLLDRGAVGGLGRESIADAASEVEFLG